MNFFISQGHQTEEKSKQLYPWFEFGSLIPFTTITVTRNAPPLFLFPCHIVILIYNMLFSSLPTKLNYSIFIFIYFSFIILSLVIFPAKALTDAFFFLLGKSIGNFLVLSPILLTYSVALYFLEKVRVSYKGVGIVIYSFDRFLLQILVSKR